MDDIASTTNNAAVPDSNAITANVRRGLDEARGVSFSKKVERTNARQPSCLLEQEGDNDHRGAGNAGDEESHAPEGTDGTRHSLKNGVRASLLVGEAGQRLGERINWHAVAQKIIALIARSPYYSILLPHEHGTNSGCIFLACPTQYRGRVRFRSWLASQLPSFFLHFFRITIV